MHDFIQCARRPSAYYSFWRDSGPTPDGWFLCDERGAVMAAFHPGSDDAHAAWSVSVSRFVPSNEGGLGVGATGKLAVLDCLRSMHPDQAAKWQLRVEQVMAVLEAYVAHPSQQAPR